MGTRIVLPLVSGRWMRRGITLLLIAVLAIAIWLADARLPREALALYAPAPFSSPIDPSNDPPVIHRLHGDAQFYTSGAGPTALDQAPEASVTDPDSPRFDGGVLTVRIVSGGVPTEDVLGLALGSGISLTTGTNVGSVVLVFDTPMGTVTANGQGGADLTISLGAFANPTAATLLVQAATFENASLTPTEGARTVRFTVSDGAGGGSGTADVLVVVTGPEGVQQVYLPLVLNGATGR